MLDNLEFVAISDAEGAGITGGTDWWRAIADPLVLTAIDLIQGVIDGYNAGSPKP